MPETKWTQESIIEELQDLARRLGHSPTQREAPNALVCAARRHCSTLDTNDGWNWAKEAAELKTYPRYGPQTVGWVGYENTAC